MNKFLCDNAAALEQGAIRVMFEKAKHYPDSINLGIGEPSATTPAPIIEAAFDAVRGGYTHYTPNAGVLEVRQQAAAYLARYGINRNPANEVIITCGGMGSVSMALLCAISKGTGVLIQDPQWLNYAAQIRFMGGVPQPVRVDEANGFNLQAADVEAAITPETKILILNSPNNPTGAVTDRKTLQELTEVAIRHDLLVISDEVYCELLYDGIVHQSIATLPGMAERTVIINSLSKTFAMTGWRVGFAAGPAHFITKMVYLQENLVSCAATPGQYGAAYALRTMCGIEEMRAQYQWRRDMLVDALTHMPGITCPRPQGAFYAFPNIKGTGLTSTEVANLLLEEAGVVTVPGNAFGQGGEGYLRVSYAVSDELLEKAIQRMGWCLTNRYSVKKEAT